MPRRPFGEDDARLDDVVVLAIPPSSQHASVKGNSYREWKVQVRAPGFEGVVVSRDERCCQPLDWTTIRVVLSLEGALDLASELLRACDAVSRSEERSDEAPCQRDG